MVMAAILILAISAASSAHARRRMRCFRIKDGVRVYRSCARTYETFHVDIQKPPNADAMDDDAWRRWYESFLPSSRLVIGEGSRRWHKSFRPYDDDLDEDEPRYLNCYSYPVQEYGHLVVGLTGSEPEEMANKPGVVRVFHNMGQPTVVPSVSPCSRNVSLFEENSLQTEFEDWSPDASPSGG